VSDGVGPGGSGAGHGTASVVASRTGDYHGRATLCLDNGAIRVEVLATGGPRIVRLALAGSPDNLLAETPDVGWDTPHGRYELLGGHRLWFAPEDPGTVAIPDAAGPAARRVGSGVRLSGGVEPGTGLVRAMEVRLDASAPAVSIRHELRNRGRRPLDLAPWSITQLPLGGRVLLPQPRATPGHSVRPNRNVVLWPYTSWEDPRIAIRDGLVVVSAIGGADLKLGSRTDAGWVAYERAGVALVRRFAPALGDRHADLESNVETYCGERYLELEVLGPLRLLEPGATCALEERWEVRSLGTEAGDAVPVDANELAERLALPLDAPGRRTA
jgi:hypothetical protein